MNSHIWTVQSIDDRMGKPLATGTAPLFISKNQRRVRWIPCSTKFLPNGKNWVSGFKKKKLTSSCFDGSVGSIDSRYVLCRTSSNLVWSQRNVVLAVLCFGLPIILFFQYSSAILEIFYDADQLALPIEECAQSAVLYWAPYCGLL